MKRTLIIILATGAIATGLAACGGASSNHTTPAAQQTQTQIFDQTKQDGINRSGQMIDLLQQAETSFDAQDYTSGCLDVQGAVAQLPALTADVNTLDGQGADVSGLRQSETQVQGQLADLTATCALGNQR